MPKKRKCIKAIICIIVFALFGMTVFLIGLYRGRYQSTRNRLEFGIARDLRQYEAIRERNIKKARAQMAISILSSYKEYMSLNKNPYYIIRTYAYVGDNAREGISTQIEKLREEMMEDIERGTTGVTTDRGEWMVAFSSETENKEKPPLSEIVDEQPEVSPQFGEEWIVPGLKMHFVFVEPGEFKMGSEGEMAFKNENPVNDIKLPAPFWIGKYEVTQKQFERVMGYNESSFEGEDRPVEVVTWDEAVEFCKRLTKIEKQLDRLPEDYEYRLPSEAEWEYAAQGGHKRQDYIYSGRNDPGEVAWYKANSDDRTHKVGRKKPNELGIHDMSGNVMEWCVDWYERDYYEEIRNRNPVNLDKAAKKVAKGGAWRQSSRSCRISTRTAVAPGKAGVSLGFRVVLAPAMKK